MKHFDADIFSLDIFEGPLAFLLQLIQKSEINIADIPIKSITSQYLDRVREKTVPSVDVGAEFIGSASLLLWMKSKTLLPQQLADETASDEQESSREMIWHLLEYCQFKEAAALLSEKEESRRNVFERGQVSLPLPKKERGLAAFPLTELVEAFRNILSKNAEKKEVISEEPWKVSDKISYIRDCMTSKTPLLFASLFAKGKDKIELIVTFLAILELMKGGEIVVLRNEESLYLQRSEEA